MPETTINVGSLLPDIDFDGWCWAITVEPEIIGTDTEVLLGAEAATGTLPDDTAIDLDVSAEGTYYTLSLESPDGRSFRRSFVIDEDTERPVGWWIRRYNPPGQASIPGVTHAELAAAIAAQWTGAQTGPVRLIIADGIVTVGRAVPDWTIYVASKQQLPFTADDFTGPNGNPFEALAGGTEVFPPLWAGSNRHVAFWTPTTSPEITSVSAPGSGFNSIAAYSEAAAHVNIGGVAGRVLESIRLTVPRNPVTRYVLGQPF